MNKTDVKVQGQPGCGRRFGPSLWRCRGRVPQQFLVLSGKTACSAGVQRLQGLGVTVCGCGTVVVGNEEHASVLDSCGVEMNGRVLWNRSPAIPRRP